VAEHKATPTPEARNAKKAAARMEEKHPELPQAAAAFRAAAVAQSGAEEIPDFRDPEVIREAWASLTEDLLEKAAGESDGFIGQLKAKALRWFADKGERVIEEQLQVLAQVLEAELASGSAEEPDVTVELGGIIELEDDHGEVEEVLEVTLEISRAAFNDPAAFGDYVLGELTDQLQEQGWEDWLG
jgi:hypothetical protein